MSIALPVHLGDRPVATIHAAGQATTLRYEDAWLAAPDRFPVSLASPLQPGPHGSEVVWPWLMNFLPEGEPLRAMTRALGAAPEDALGLLAQVGGDLAGALSIGPRPPVGEPGHRHVPDAAALERIIDELPVRPFLAGKEGVSMSLAGAQDKLLVAIVDGAIAVPIHRAPSTHILKPDNPRLAGSVENEALCMVVARRMGLDVAPVATGVRVGDATCSSAGMIASAVAFPPAASTKRISARPSPARQRPSTSSTAPARADRRSPTCSGSSAGT